VQHNSIAAFADPVDAAVPATGWSSRGAAADIFSRNTASATSPVLFVRTSSVTEGLTSSLDSSGSARIQTSPSQVRVDYPKAPAAALRVVIVLVGVDQAWPLLMLVALPFCCMFRELPSSLEGMVECGACIDEYILPRGACCPHLSA